MIDPHPFHRSVIRLAIEDPDRLAIVSAERRVTYGRLAGRAANLARAFREKGVSSGDRVVLNLAGKEAMVCGLVAALGIGAIGVPFSGEAEQLDKIAHDSDAALVATDEETETTRQSIAVAAFLDGENGDLAIFDFDPSSSDVALLMYTSGTTSGQPRGVIQTYDTLWRNTRNIVEAQGMSGVPVEVATAPFHHAFGLGRARTVLSKGGTLHISEGRLNLGKVVKALSDPSVNALSGVSSVFAELAGDLAPVFRTQGEKLRWIEVGSLPLDLERAESLCAACPNARIVMNYGLTESMRSTFFDLRESSVRQNSVGRAAGGSEVCIFDKDGEALPPGETGEIAVRGDSLSDGYWQQESVWAAKMLGGWFHSGDVGYIDSDGYVYYVGRLDDQINVGGEKINPERVEAALRAAFPKINVAVAGVPDPAGSRGHVPAYFVEGSADEQPSPAVVRQALQNVLQTWEIPAAGFVMAQFPRTRNGKVIRARLNSSDALALRD